MGLRPEKDCVGEVEQQLQFTESSSQQRGCHTRKKCNCLKKMSMKEKEKLAVSPKQWPDTRTDWPTDYQSYDNV
jgi:hypothetical protein